MPGIGINKDQSGTVAVAFALQPPKDFLSILAYKWPFNSNPVPPDAAHNYATGRARLQSVCLVTLIRALRVFPRDFERKCLCRF